MHQRAFSLLFAALADIVAASTATSALLNQPTDAASQARIFSYALPDGEPNICSLHCDGRAASQAQEDLTPLGDVESGGRKVKLHVSDKDVMAWASLAGAKKGDAVWLERSWDGGKKGKREKLGKVVAKGTGKGKEMTTDMYNLADPSSHRRGVVRACTDAGGKESHCTDWAYEQACQSDGICDGQASPEPGAGYFPVPATSLDGRTLELHVDKETSMSWATIRAAQPGDEVWLDRSWDADVMNQVTALGRERVPKDGDRADTKLFSARDVRLLMYGGAVRACGRTDKTSTCTNWARPNADRAGAAMDALIFDFQIYTAWWLSSWWNSAVATHTVTDYMRQSGDEQYLWLIERVLTINKEPFPAGVKSTDELPGDFLSRAIDDALWWGLGWADAFALTKNGTYLDAARKIADYGAEFYDEETCDGGIWWDEERTYKNAVTIGQYIKLSAQLHALIEGDTEYLDRAQKAWDWYVSSSLINSGGFVNDGLTDECENNNGTVWTYNQGLGIGAGVEIWRITADEAALDQARKLADATISEGLLTVDGILTEVCDAEGTCDDNQKQFKGIFMRYMADLAVATGEDKYATYVRVQADSIWENDRDSLNRLGQSWDGDSPNVHDWRTQASALGGLIAELRLDA